MTVVSEKLIIKNNSRILFSFETTLFEKKVNYQSKRKAQTYPFLIGDGYYRDRLLQKEPPEAFYKKDVL